MNLQQGDDPCDLYQLGFVGEYVKWVGRGFTPAVTSHKPGGGGKPPPYRTNCVGGGPWTPRRRGMRAVEGAGPYKIQTH